MLKGIPAGTEDYKRIIQSNCYYVDKTSILQELFVHDASSVMLIIRPRRFGKTLTLSTIKYFLSNQIDPTEQQIQSLDD